MSAKAKNVLTVLKKTVFFSKVCKAEQILYKIMIETNAAFLTFPFLRISTSSVTERLLLSFHTPASPL